MTSDQDRSLLTRAFCPPFNSHSALRATFGSGSASTHANTFASRWSRNGGALPPDERSDRKREAMTKPRHVTPPSRSGGRNVATIVRWARGCSRLLGLRVTCSEGSDRTGPLARPLWEDRTGVHTSSGVWTIGSRRGEECRRGARPIATHAAASQCPLQ